MWWRKKRTEDKTEVESFHQRIRNIITENTSETGGICVFEHDGEGDFDDVDRQKIEILREAHTDWTSKNNSRIVEDSFDSRRTAALTQITKVG